MTDSLLLSIRQGIIEGRSLPDLLRSCILLGSDTNSQLLQEWARKELEGYEDNDDLPTYRHLAAPPVIATIQAGYQTASNVNLGPYDVPEQARKYFPEDLRFAHPIRTIIEWSEQDKPITFVTDQLLAVRTIHNNKHAPLNQIVAISAQVDKSHFSGLTDRVLTLLTSMIADLTQNNPMQEIPSTEKVDRTVMKHVENHYETHIERASGPVAIGTKAAATQTGLSVEDLILLIERINLDQYELDEQQREAAKRELASAANELQTDKPDGGALRRIFATLIAIGKAAGDRAFTGSMEELGSKTGELIASFP